MKRTAIIALAAFACAFSFGDEVVKGFKYVDISKYANGDFTNARGKSVVFKESPVEADGVKFEVSTSENKSAIIFSPENPALKKVSFDFRDPVRATALNVLHTETGCYQSRGKPVGKLIIKYADGKQQAYKIVYAVDVMDAALGQKRANAQPLKISTHNFYYGSFFPLRKDAAVSRIVFEANGDGVKWAIAGVSFSEKMKTFSPDDAGWVKLDMDELEIENGSALDLSSTFKCGGEAGAYGRLTVSPEGKFAFEKNPEKTPRFQGTVWYMYFENMTLPDGGRDYDATKKNLARLATILRKHGYNMLRFHMLSVYQYSSRATRDKELDLFDFLMAELKKNGIYVQLILLSNDMGMPPPFKWEDKTDIKIGMILGEKRIRDQWKELMRFQLDHVNPYTKVAWKDDPMIMSVEPWNEFDLALMSREYSKEQLKAVNAAFAEWLKARYGAFERMKESSAWKDADLKSFDDVDVSRADCFRNVDWSRFFTERASETFAFYENFLRKDIGYKGLITNLNHNTPFLYLYRLAWMHAEFNALNPYNYRPGDGVFADVAGKCNPVNPLFDAASRWRCAVSKRSFDRPIVLTEYNTRQPSPYKFLNGLIFGGYSAFQDFGFINIQDDPVRTTTRVPATRIKVHSSAVLRAAEFMAHCLFTRGDVAPSKHRVEVFFDKDFCENNPAMCRGVNDDQSRIGLMTGFGVRFPEDPVPAAVRGAKPRQPDMVLKPVAAASAKELTIGDVSYASDGGKFDLQKTISEMKARGILPENNISDAEKQIYQSDTGEITMRVNDEVLKFVTPNTEATSLKAGAGEKLGKLNILKTDAACAAAAISVDGKPLGESKRIVFIFATDNLPSGSVFTPDMTGCIAEGGLPTLLKPGKISAELEVPCGGFKLYALALSGKRREEIPAKYDGGKLKFSIDNTVFKNGGTVFFEIVKE